ncbi:tetratricopeptide repeat protein [Leptolyngbya sp. FACHB-36]|uniref:tetratricopeptide repeat protein n=1 Tax=Leptolyngbya sp. FACHB-36 TaxID=2692808 RepID=UPI001681BFF0|nr:tetratricopeptide repeat protein [Leptolyngbya sp. FACHB-36]
MTEKRNRWMINLVLILSVVAFVGFSVFPIFSSVLEVSKAPPTTSPSASPSASAQPKKEQLESQVKGYESVLQRESENETALKGLIEARLGLISIGAGDVKDVIPPLEKLAKLKPAETDYSVLLAQAKQQTGDREGAAQAYRTILETKPGTLNALDGLTTLLIQEKRPEAAIDLLQDTLKKAPQANQIQPNSVDVQSVQLLLGRAYAEQKRYDEAIAIYDEAAKAKKDDFRPVLAKAIVLKTQGKSDEAKPLFTSAATLAPARFKDQINQIANAPAPGAVAPAPTAPNSAPPTAAPSAAPAPAPSASP